MPIALALGYILPGLLGHDPWKPDEAYAFGSVDHILRTGDWVVPHVADLPFVEKPPLMHLLAALLAWLASPLLPLHDGARLAAGVCVGLSFYFTMRTAAMIWGNDAARPALALTLGSLGLVVEGHMLIPDLLVMTSLSGVAMGLTAISLHRPYGGLILGTAAGVGFLAKGLFVPGTAGLGVVLSMLMTPALRSRHTLQQLALATVISAPWLLIWPTLLYLRSPELFYEWFWLNNIGRFFGYPAHQLGADHTPWYWFKTYPWLIAPGWIFLALGWRRIRAAAKTNRALLPMVSLALALLLVLGVSRSARAIYALPLIPIVAMIAAGATPPPRWFDRTLYGAGAALGLVVGTVAVILWLSLLLRGQAPAWPGINGRLPLAFDLPFWRWGTLGAGLLILVLIALLRAKRTGISAGLMMWCCGLTLAYGLAATLLLPWIDAARSYRSVFVAMTAQLPPSVNCLASIGVGESGRAMLRYATGLSSRPVADGEAVPCNALLVQTLDGAAPPVRPDQWRAAWQGARPSDAREQMFLFLR